MTWLIDTNVLLRLRPGEYPLLKEARTAVKGLHRRGQRMCITPQNLIEFWNVATRPVERNGLGLSVSQAEEELTQLEALFDLLPDTEAIFEVWRHLVVSLRVSGVQVHDARLAAMMRVHDIRRILTFNVQDFTRYPDIVAVHPAEWEAGI